MLVMHTLVQCFVHDESSVSLDTQYEVMVSWYLHDVVADEGYLDSPEDTLHSVMLTTKDHA